LGVWKSINERRDPDHENRRPKKICRTSSASLIPIRQDEDAYNQIDLKGNATSKNENQSFRQLKKMPQQQNERDGRQYAYHQDYLLT
jgi:hypothetical protein